MSGPTNRTRARVTDHQRAEARAHVELLRSQRENPLPLLEQLQREQPENTLLWENIAAHISFNSSRLESVLPIVAKDIYTSVDRVVLELIQNADDAKYTHAQGEKCTPYINFTLFPDKIILEYNEDGFTRDDVHRICDINNSNKGEDDIGEKGIGFKSVFMIASKVHIESREYSFSFQYSEGDNALRMFTPQYEASDHPPVGCTRITLTLVEGQHIRTEALQKFREVPTTLLLFLRHIKKLSIVEHLEDGAQSSAISTSYEELGERGVLTRRGRTAELSVEKQFHIFRQVFHDIPTTGQKRKNPNAEVKLAFPLRPNHTPLIEMQPDIFARLPISSTGVGLHFLVHSDFSTSANREAVDERSERNGVLLDKIAELFQVAVNEFCNSPYLPLRHQWLEFLPDDSVSSTFWSALRIKIESTLAGTPFLRSRSGRLDLVSNLRYVPNMFRDSPEEGSNPLFHDLPDHEKYLHPDYEAHLEKLKTLDLKDLTPEEMVDRVKRDAESDLFSSIRTNADDRWHTHVALFLLSCRDNYPDEWARLQALPLIPIIPANFHNWTSTLNAKVYYPTVGNVSVPTDLELSLVTTDAASRPARKRLFKALGVDDPPCNLVRQRILGKYQTSHTTGLEASLAHLRFLWWTHQKDYKYDSKLYGRVHVFNKDNGPVFPRSSEIFFDSDDPFGVRELFPSDSGLILHQAYLEAPSPTERPGHSSWKEWLRDFIGVQEYPRLADRDKPTELSPIFERISRDSPDKVVGLLRAHWSKYNEPISESIKQKVSNIKVPHTNGNGTSVQFALKLGDLPHPALRKACESFAVAGRYPFLTLPAEVTNCDLTGWDFLTAFGVNKELNLKFYLWILFFFKLLEGSIVQERVFKLYVQIQCQCVQAESCQEAQKTVRTFYKDNKVVFVPTSKPGSFSWNAPEECLWDAPSYMQSKIPLLARYRSITDTALPTEFFQETLRIRNTTSADLLDELESMRPLESDVCLDNIKDIYVRLNAMRLADGSIGDAIRERFETSGLIWIPSEMGCWKSPSSCLWSSKAQITDKHTVSRQYGQGEHKKELKTFFVDCLNVAEPTLHMLAEELQLLARAGLEPSDKDVSVGRIKIIMQVINSMSLSESGPVRENLRSSAIFPVRLEDGSLRLESVKGEFSIRDRENYWKAFNERVPMLELTLEEVHELGPFLRWMDLESRYLSNRVTERSEFSGTPEECSKKLTEDLRFRATALFRCAVHFKSPRTRGNDASLFSLLSRAKVYQTSGISTFLDLSQTVNGREKIVTVRSSTSKLHIEQKSKTELRFFVPSEEKQRLLCYCKLLPERLLTEFFMKKSKSDHSETDMNAARVLAAVLNVPRDKQMLEDLLTEFGIRGLPEWSEDDVTGLSTGLDITLTGSSDESDDEVGSQTSIDSFATSASGSRSSAESADSDHSARIDQADSTSTFSSSSPSHRTGTTPRPRVQATETTTIHPHSHRVSAPAVHGDSESGAGLESQDEYVKLLGRIRDAAREANIPTHGPFNMSALTNAIENEPRLDSPHPTTAFGTRSVNQLKHDMKMGAAGELFVYDLLSNLPCFPSGRKLNLDPSNWPSSIRDYVRVHLGCAADFPEVEKPAQREQADIIFDDKDGDFTQYLIDKLYLEPERHRRAKPIKYFIEVKTTLKKCDTKFYMSKSQYRRMHDIAAEQDDVVHKVYLIFRVFYLDTQDIGLHIYADPGELDFVEESYTVTPKVGSK